MLHPGGLHCAPVLTSILRKPTCWLSYLLSVYVTYREFTWLFDVEAHVLHVLHSKMLTP